MDLSAWQGAAEPKILPIDTLGLCHSSLLQEKRTERVIFAEMAAAYIAADVRSATIAAALAGNQPAEIVQLDRQRRPERKAWDLSQPHLHLNMRYIDHHNDYAKPTRWRDTAVHRRTASDSTDTGHSTSRDRLPPTSEAGNLSPLPWLPICKQFL